MKSFLCCLLFIVIISFKLFSIEGIEEKYNLSDLVNDSLSFKKIPVNSIFKEEENERTIFYLYNYFHQFSFYNKENRYSLEFNEDGIRNFFAVKKNNLDLRLSYSDLSNIQDFPRFFGDLTSSFYFGNITLEQNFIVKDDFISDSLMTLFENEYLIFYSANYLNRNFFNQTQLGWKFNNLIFATGLDFYKNDFSPNFEIGFKSNKAVFSLFYRKDLRQWNYHNYSKNRQYDWFFKEEIIPVDVISFDSELYLGHLYLSLNSVYFLSPEELNFKEENDKFSIAREKKEKKGVEVRSELIFKSLYFGAEYKSDRIILWEPEWFINFAYTASERFSLKYKWTKNDFIFLNDYNFHSCGIAFNGISLHKAEIFVEVWKDIYGSQPLKSSDFTVSVRIVF